LAAHRAKSRPDGSTAKPLNLNETWRFALLIYILTIKGFVSGGKNRESYFILAFALRLIRLLPEKGKAAAEVTGGLC